MGLVVWAPLPRNRLGSIGRGGSDCSGADHMGLSRIRQLAYGGGYDHGAGRSAEKGRLTAAIATQLSATNSRTVKVVTSPEPRKEFLNR